MTEEKKREDIKTTLEFSSADSLESSMSLVSGGVSSNSQLSSQSQMTSASSEVTSEEVTEVIVNAERGTREKRYKDGRVEIWYSNGNRKEIFTGLTKVIHLKYLQ